MELLYNVCLKFAKKKGIPRLGGIRRAQRKIGSDIWNGPFVRPFAGCTPSSCMPVEDTINEQSEGSSPPFSSPGWLPFSYSKTADVCPGNFSAGTIITRILP